MHRADQFQKPDLLVEIDPIRTQVDSGQYDFAISICRKMTHFLHYALRTAAAHPPSRIRNNAVGAKLVASILHFDICSRMFSGLRQMQLLIFMCMIDIDHFFFYI